MPYAITLRLDAEALSRVSVIREALDTRGLNGAAPALDYPPHMTLGVFSDDADRARLVSAARDCAARWPRFDITLASLGIFPGDPATLFLAPVVTVHLLERHADLLALLAGERIDPRFDTGNWVPHVTLASGVTTVPVAYASAGQPLTATLTAMEVVRFPPAEIIASHKLIDGDC